MIDVLEGIVEDPFHPVLSQSHPHLEGTTTNFFSFYFILFIYLFLKYGTLHEFACHPCAGAMLIFSVLFQF